MTEIKSILLHAFITAFVVSIFGYLYKTWIFNRYRSTKNINQRKEKLLFTLNVFCLTFLAVLIYLYFTDSKVETLDTTIIDVNKEVIIPPMISDPNMDNPLPLLEIVETPTIESHVMIETPINQSNQGIEIRKKKTTPKYRRGLPM